jgi:hypothetical protein
LWTDPRDRVIQTSDYYFHNINKFFWDVVAPTYSRKSAHRWRWGCQLYAPATLYPQEDSWYSLLLQVKPTPGAVVRL